MTQADLLDWVTQHGCLVTHSKKNFHRVVNPEGQAMGIPCPRPGHTKLQPITVCRICHKLKVPIPDYAKEAFDSYTSIQDRYKDNDIEKEGL